MKRILALLLLLSISFAFNQTVPSCVTSNSILGINFTVTTMGQSLTCKPSNIFGAGFETTLGDTLFIRTYENNVTVSDIDSNFLIDLPDSGNFTVNGSAEGVVGKLGLAGTCQRANITDFNSTTYQVQCGGLINLTKGTDRLLVAGTKDTVISKYNYSTSAKESRWGLVSQNLSVFGMTYVSHFNHNGIIRSDLKTANTAADASKYCRVMLYFNNPYYGNIQLFPQITYIPGTDAFAYFYNTTDYVPYLPNGTLTYVYDSTTSTWYVVPAYTCSSYSVIGSTSVLQYNPTGTGVAGGEVPIDITAINGTCTYASATRVVTCTGTDSSATINVLNLTAYLTGNTSAACFNSTLGSTGTLTCSIPNVNGTYNVLFYGTDPNLFVHELASTTVTVGGMGGVNTTYGRDGYLAAVIIVAVCAMVASYSIAISMVLACFGLFLAIGIGIIPASTSVVVAILMAVVAFMIAYRLRI